MAITVLERQHLTSASDLGRLGGGSRTVVGMNTIEVGLRQELVPRVAENVLDGGIDAREVAVEVRDRDQVAREIEDAVDLRLRLRSSPGDDAQPCGEEAEDEPRGEDDSGKRRGRAADRRLRHDDAEVASRNEEVLANGVPPNGARRSTG